MERRRIGQGPTAETTPEEAVGLPGGETLKPWMEAPAETTTEDRCCTCGRDPLPMATAIPCRRCDHWMCGAGCVVRRVRAEMRIRNLCRCCSSGQDEEAEEDDASTNRGSEEGPDTDPLPEDRMDPTPMCTQCGEHIRNSTGLCSDCYLERNLRNSEQREVEAGHRCS